MRMSCNGCRVLRKGCSEDCSIRPCLQWIKSPEAQGNATVFLAKFYGRAGLLNLINAGPEHLRPAIFRSLLYEACGRVVNPIYGSVGLLWSGSWQLCQAAVDNVLKGAPIVQISTEAATATAKAFDIRHVPREEGGPAQELHGVAKAGRTRFKRRREEERAKSHESVTTAVAAAAEVAEEEEEEEENENESMVSEETAEGSMVTSHADSVVRLELTLGPTPATKRSPPTKKFGMVGDGEGDTCTTMDLALDLSR